MDPVRLRSRPWSWARQSGRYYYEQQVRLIELFAEQNHLPSDHVAVFCGSRSPLQYAMALYAGQRSVVTAAPTYDSVANGAEALGAKVHEVPLMTVMPTTCAACSRRTIRPA